MLSKIRINHIIRSTGILMAAFLANKILAIGRQIVIARAFGTGAEYDAFVAAFRLPDILFLLISGGALGTAFIPILSERLTKRPADDPDGWRLTSGVLNTLLLVVIAISIIMALFANPLVEWIVAPGFSPEIQDLTANLMRLTLISTIIFSVSSLVGAVLHTHQHFILPAIAPLIYNIGIMAGALFLVDDFGVYGLIWGAILGSLGHFLIQVPGLLRYGVRYRPIFAWNDPDLWHIARLMGPRVLNIVVIQVNFIVMFNLASRLGEGSVSALDYGWDLMQMPQTIIGSAIGIVLFPTLSELAARNDIATLRHTLAQTLRIMLALAIPAMVGLIVLGRPIIQVMFERGEFGPDSTAAVYQSLQFWALALIAHCALEVVNRVFYAQKDTITPFLSSVVSMIINLGLALLLYQRLLAGGLALSNGVAVTVEVLIMLVIAHYRLNGVEAGSIANTLLLTLLSAGAMGGAVWAFITFFPMLSPIFIAAFGGIIGVATYLLVGLAVGVKEIRLIPRLVGRGA
ncbi:MAG: murein biosynthesis integral membrane protein MurJ [Anaerolineae bacterium]|nr:murein biosynthesis integral membrane protein MurJ [Anaerolineae bacterium]